MTRGRKPELDSARRSRIEVRLHERERAALVTAADRAGLPVSEWARVQLLTASGRPDLCEQLARVRPSREQELDTYRRGRCDEIRNGLKTPWWATRALESQPQPIAFGSAAVLHFMPSELAWDPDDVWPPAIESPDNSQEALLRALRDGERWPIEAIETRRAALLELLLGTRVGVQTWPTLHAEDGYILDCHVACDAMPPERVKPHAYSFLRRNGTIEAAFDLDHRSRDRELDLTTISDLIAQVPNSISLLHQLGATFPVHVALTLHGVRGRTVRGPSPTPTTSGRYPLGHRFHDDELLLPIVTAKTPEIDVRELLRRPLDALWHFSGFPSCHLLDR